MAGFGNKVLGVLERIYGFRSQDKSISKFQLEMPIQPVHDVSRQAELGSGVGRFDGLAIMATWGVNHAAGNTQRYVIDPYASVIGGALPLDPVKTYLVDDIDIWMLAFNVVSDANNEPATAFRFAWVANGDIPPYNAEAAPVFFFEGNGTTANISNYAGTGNISLLQGEPCDVATARPVQLPFRFPHTGRVTITSTSTGAVNVFVHALLWIGARGTSPPGMR